MTDPGFAGWLSDRRVEESPARQVARMAYQAEARQDHREAVAEAEQELAAADAADDRAMRFMQAGIRGRGLGDVFDMASRAADEDALYAEALKTIERIDKRRASRAEAQRYQAERLAEASRATGDPLEQVNRTAHEAFRQHTRQLMAEAVTGAPRARRPFISRSGAVRSESCYWCTQEGLDDETSFMLHSDPQFPLPVTSPEQAAQEERDEQEAGRYRPAGTGGGTPMIYR